MTKNQVNYLLVLLTLVVVWLYLNTIVMVGVKANKMNYPVGMRQPSGMMVPGQFAPQFQPKQAQMSLETKRMLDQFRNTKMNSGNLPASIPTPADAQQEKK